jgi:hypothetical protein
MDTNKDVPLAKAIEMVTKALMKVSLDLCDGVHGMLLCLCFVDFSIS